MINAHRRLPRFLQLNRGLSLAAAILAGAASSLTGTCGSFSDVAADAFCPFVLEIFYLGITTGATPTTYDPSANVSRLQMAAFLSRTVDSALRRGSRRAALDQFWTTHDPNALGVTTLATFPEGVASDGADVWVSLNNATVSRVHGSDGRLLETWSGAPGASSVLVAMGRILVTGSGNPGNLYSIDPSQPAGSVTIVSSALGHGAYGIAFDGSRVWTANYGSAGQIDGSVSIVTPGSTIPWSATTVTAGFGRPIGILYDGVNIWIADMNAYALMKLDSSGAILQHVAVASAPALPVFDGSNIWVPGGGSDDSSVAVVHASSGAVLATLTGNGLSVPSSAAFDGQRILITNGTGNSVSLWKAADLTPLGSVQVGAGGFSSPYTACSDGINFWVTLFDYGQLVRF